MAFTKCSRPSLLPNFTSQGAIYDGSDDRKSLRIGYFNRLHRQAISLIHEQLYHRTPTSLCSEEHPTMCYRTTYYYMVCTCYTAPQIIGEPCIRATSQKGLSRGCWDSVDMGVESINARCPACAACHKSTRSDSIDSIRSTSSTSSTTSIYGCPPQRHREPLLKVPTLSYTFSPGRGFEDPSARYSSSTATKQTSRHGKRATSRFPPA